MKAFAVQPTQPAATAPWYIIYQEEPWNSGLGANGGYQVELDEEDEPELAAAAPTEEGQKYAVGFWMRKPGGRVHSRKASAGERKIAKALSQIVCLPPERIPHVVLVDNIEMHVHHTRHLSVVEELKKLFAGKQIIATTHSTIIMEKYQPRTDLVDVEGLALASR